MPEDVGGTPFSDGREPDDDRDRGGADEEFASVVFDEDFVRSAAIHEPSAVERLLAAAQARAEAEHLRGTRRDGSDDEPDTFDHDPDRPDPYGHEGYHAYYGHHGHSDDEDHHDHDAYGADGSGDSCDACAAELAQRMGSRRAPGRWHRPVAWMLALLMGIGMVALAFAAVYRASSSNRQDPVPPPATTGVDGGPSASAGYSAPPIPAQSRTP